MGGVAVALEFATPAERKRWRGGVYDQIQEVNRTGGGGGLIAEIAGIANSAVIGKPKAHRGGAENSRGRVIGKGKICQ